jgi:competence protein ComEC
MALGILLAHFIYFTFSDLVFPVAFAGGCLLLGFVWQNRPGAKLAALLAACFVAGIATQVLHRPGKTPRLNAEDGETVLLSGCVVNPSVFSPEREQFTLALGPAANIRLTVNLKNGGGLQLPYGQKIEAAAKVRSPRNFQNPDAFDYAGYLAAQHIYWTGSISSPGDIHLQPGACGSRAVGLLYAVRTWALDRIRALYPDDPHTAGLLQATLLGETGGVERRWTADFRTTGTYHALVISGQHVSVLAFTILLLLRVLRVRRIQAMAVAATVSWLYAFITGFSSPVVRAAGGFTLFLIASYFFRRLRILNALAAVGLIYLAFAPDQLFDPSFQLSFLSAAAIAAFAIPVMERFTKPLRAAVTRFDQLRYDPQLAERAGQWRVELRLVSRTLRLCGLSAKAADFLVVWGVRLGVFVADTVIVSACVQFGLALPMIAYFHRLSITGLSANIVIIPLLSLVVPLGFASIATGSHLLALLTKALLVFAERIATWHAGFEPSWRLAALPITVAIAFAGSLILLGYTIRRQKPLWIAPALAASLALFGVICWQPWKPEIAPRFLEISAIDVSQGDSLFVAFPDGETMLVDAGGFPGAERMTRKPQIDMGEDVVAPYLWSRRIRRLDYAVLTHGHSDHMGGLPAILDDFHPRQLWIGAEPDSPAWENVRQHAKADQVAIRSLRRSPNAFTIGGAQIRILAPSPDYEPAETAGNNDSLVLEISYGKHRVLLTGDAEALAENDMLQSGMLRPVTLLKVGHHGSKTSTSEDFLSVLQPRFAMISDGYQNLFHHPHPTVLERLNEHHVVILRTDQRGLISFRTDGNRIEYSTFR